MTTPGAVTVINTIEPQNDGAFPVVRSVDVQGAPQVFADTAERDAFPAAKLTVGQTVRTLADGGKDWRVTAVDPVTFSEIVPVTGAAWGDITGTLSDQTDLQGELDTLAQTDFILSQSISLKADVATVNSLHARDGVTVLDSNTIEVAFDSLSQRVATRAADGAVTIDGTGYAVQIDVDIQVTNTTGSPIAVSVIGAWALIGTAVTEIPAGETLHVAALSRGTVEGDVSYAMGLAVSP